MAKVIAVFIISSLILRDFDGGPSVDDDQGSPTILAPGTGFQRRQFFHAPWGRGVEMVQVMMGVMASSGEPQIKLHSSLAAHLLLYGGPS